MNKEIRLSLALVAMALLLLGLAACGSDDINSTSTNLVGTWTLQSYNGRAPAVAMTLFLNANGTHKWYEDNDPVFCETIGTYSYAASKIAFIDTAISDVVKCGEGTLNQEYVYGYFLDGSSLKIMASGYTLGFIK